MHSAPNNDAETREWLEADGLGGFASGTASGVRTRRYHGLLTVATTPPTGRRMLVSALEVEVDLGAGRRALSTHRYRPDVLHPDGCARLESFDPSLAPTYRYRLDGGARIDQTVAVLRDRPAVVVAWTLAAPTPGARLLVRPLLALRDLHALQRERGDLDFDADATPTRVTWRPLDDQPGVSCHADGQYRHAPLWYRDFVYTEERARGYDDREDLASPGELELDLSSGEAIVVFSAEGVGLPVVEVGGRRAARALYAAELQRRASAPSALDRAAEAYLVRRGDGRSIVAGYPWFADWGRDTFIALRGLCLARGARDEAGAILDAWSGQVSGGLLPNRFVDQGDEPEYNSVDASLWYVVVVGEYLTACERAREVVAPERLERLEAAVTAILSGYTAGTRYGIRMDSDHLLAAGEPGWQLTWMDAKVDGHVVTPRIGKPVEVQALWANALHAGARFDARWRRIRDQVRVAFSERFWCEATGHLHDVVDVYHVRGTADATLRPNQALAVGGLPLPLVEGRRARAIVDALEQRLWTPLGLRSLERAHADYRGRYRGGPVERDHAYHQGTVWPWLLCPFVDAWIRVRGGTEAARAEARERFLAPLHEHLGTAGLGHVSEVADGEPPHTPGGCPFQAWSVGELLRLERVVLAEPRTVRAPRRASAR